MRAVRISLLCVVLSSLRRAIMRLIWFQNYFCFMKTKIVKKIFLLLINFFKDVIYVPRNR